MILVADTESGHARFGNPLTPLIQNWGLIVRMTATALVQLAGGRIRRETHGHRRPGRLRLGATLGHDLDPVPRTRRALHDHCIKHRHVPDLQAAVLQLAAALRQKCCVKTALTGQLAGLADRHAGGAAIEHRPADGQPEVDAHRQRPLKLPIRQLMPLAMQEIPDHQIDIMASAS